MRAFERIWQRVGFEDPAAVERLVVRGALAGASSALLGGLVLGVMVGWQRTQHLALGAVALAGAVLQLVLPRLPLGKRLLFAGVGWLLPFFLPWSPEAMPYFFTAPLGWALALEQRTLPRRLLALAGPSLGAAWCLLITQWLTGHHLGKLAGLQWLALLGAGLFVSAGSALAWVSVAADAVAPQLASQPRAQLAWLRLRAALRKLPDGTSRHQLEALAHEGAQRLVSVRAQRDQVAAALEGAGEQEARDAVQALDERLKETADAELSSHLAQLLRVHKDTLEQLDELHRKVERLEARTAAEAGWLETAAFSVELAPKSEPSTRELTSRLRALRA